MGLRRAPADKRPLVIGDNLRFRTGERDVAQYAAESPLQILGGEGGFCRAAGQHGAFTITV